MRWGKELTIRVHIRRCEVPKTAIWRIIRLQDGLLVGDSARPCCHLHSAVLLSLTGHTRSVDRSVSMGRTDPTGRQ